MGKLSYINPSNFESEEIEFPDNQIRLAEYVEKAVHMEGFMVNGPIINETKDKLIIGVLEKLQNNNFSGRENFKNEKYKITIEKI